jgi:site-specific DNA recombinase
MARKAVAYLRMSKDDLGTGLGIERQRDSVRSLAKAKGWRIDQEIVENDVSASNKKVRPGFERLLECMRSGEVEAVLAYAVDRLVRRLDDLTRLIDIAEEYAVPVATCAGEMDLATGYGRGLAKLLGVVASIEADNMGERLRRRKLQNAQAGSLRAGGMRPFGFTANRAETIPEEAAVLREAAERVLAGSSLTSIANDLNRRGIKTSYGLAWTLPRLQDTLSRPSLAGRVVHKGELMRDEDGLPVKGEWQPILTEEQFDQLQVALAARRRSPSARWTSNRRHLLSGIARCGLCGARLTGSKQTNGLLAYSCPVFRHLCRSKPHLDEYVVKAVKEKAGSTSFDIEGWSDEAAEDTRRQIADLERRKHDSITQLVDGKIDAATLTAVTAQYSARIDALRESLIGRTVEAEAFDAVTFDLEGFDAMPLEEQHAAIAMFVRKIVVHPAGRGKRFDPALIEICWRDPDSWHWRGIVEAGS